MKESEENEMEQVFDFHLHLHVDTVFTLFGGLFLVQQGLSQTSGQFEPV